MATTGNIVLDNVQCNDHFVPGHDETTLVMN